VREGEGGGGQVDDRDDEKGEVEEDGLWR